MRTTSNPVIRNLLVATSHTPQRRETKASKRLSHLRRASATERLLSTDDVVVKTVLSLGVVVVCAFLSAIFDLGALAIPALLVALGLTIYSIVRPRPSRSVTITYAIAEGVLIGSVIDVMESVLPDIAVQGAIGTIGVFAGLLVVYRTRKLRITPKFTRWVIGTIVGTLILTLANIIAIALGTDLGLYDGGTVSIIVAVAHRPGVAEPTAQLRRRRPDAPTRRGRDVVLVPRVRPGRHPRMALHRHRVAHHLLPLTSS